MNKQRKEIISTNRITKLLTYTLGGFEQKVLLDGKDEHSPILIFLHGGPGSPIPFCEGCRGMFPQLTNQVIMVYWDQLGCGINNHVINDTFTIDHFVRMTVDLIKSLKKDFPDNPINLFGVSWGSILVAKAASEVPGLINRVLIYGQVFKNIFFNEEVFDALNCSRLPQKYKTSLSQLRNKDVHTADDVKRIARWIQRYTEGYMSKSGGKLNLKSIILGILFSPDYSFKDFIAIVVNGYRHNNSLLTEVLKIDLTEVLQSIQVPYLIMQGSNDIVTSSKGISEFVSSCNNKYLKYQLIDNSGHFPNADGMETIISEGIPFTCIEARKQSMDEQNV